MQFRHILLGSLALGLATPQNNTGIPNLPINGQIGSLHFPLACSILGATEVFDGVFTGTGPAVVGPGQESYLTEGTVKVTVPSSLFVNLASLLGVTQASALIHANFSGTNIEPKIFPIFPDGLQINNVSIPFGKDIVVKTPADGGVLPPIGPLRAGKEAGRGVVFFSSVLIELSLQDKAGNTIISDIPVTCAQPEPNIQLFVVSVHGEAGQPPLTIESGGAGTFPSVPDNFEVGSFRFPYTCDIEHVGSRDIDLLLSGTVPTYLAPGGEFSITNASSYLRLPTSIATALIGKYPQISTFKTVIESFFVTTTAASPAAINAIAEPLTLDVGDGNGNLTIAVPASGYLPPIGPITADQTVGDTVFIGTGKASARILLADQSGAQIANLSVNCSPSVPIDFIGFPITNSKPPVYSG